MSELNELQNRLESLVNKEKVGEYGGMDLDELENRLSLLDRVDSVRDVRDSITSLQIRLVLDDGSTLSGSLGTGPFRLTLRKERRTINRDVEKPDGELDISFVVNAIERFIRQAG